MAKMAYQSMTQRNPGEKNLSVLACEVCHVMCDAFDRRFAVQCILFLD